MANYTTVTGTIVDPNGTPYAGGKINASAPRGVTWLNGQPIVHAGGGTTQTLDATGSFSMVLPDNGQMLPSGSQWTFYVEAPDGTTGFSSAQTITGTSQSLTSALTTAALAFYVSNLVAARVTNIVEQSHVLAAAANGALWTEGSASELMTLSTSGATTDSVANLLPANSIIEAVVARVITTITTATDWKLGDGTTAARFTAADSTLTAGETQVGILQWSGAVSTLAAGPSQAAAAKLRITCTGTAGAGAIRVTVFFRTYTAPTS